MFTYKKTNVPFLKVLSLVLCTVILLTGVAPVIASAAAVADFSATPRISGRAVISPGGTDQLVFRYSYTSPTAAVAKIEIKIGKVWRTILSTTQSEPGVKTYAWDGRVSGKALRAGTYSVRLTMPDATKTIQVRILPKPKVTVYAVKPSTFKATGKSTATIQARWTQLCDVRIDVVNAAGVVVRTLYSAQNRTAAKVSLRWDGKDDQGQLVPSGVYRVRTKCGGAAAVTRKFKVVSTASTTTMTTSSITVTLASTPTTTPQQVQSSLADLINSGRQANGLAPLAANAALSAGALKHSQDMLANNYFSHVSPTYGTMADRMKAAGIVYWCAAENLALTGNAERAYEQFMESAGHRANILNADMADIGVGVVWNPATCQYIVAVWFAKLQ